MVRKYMPEKEEIWHPYEELPEVRLYMEESKHGEWVSLTTYLNETKRLRAQVARLKKQLEEMK